MIAFTSTEEKKYSAHSFQNLLSAFLSCKVLGRGNKVVSGLELVRMCNFHLDISNGKKKKKKQKKQDNFFRDPVYSAKMNQNSVFHLCPKRNLWKFCIKGK